MKLTHKIVVAATAALMGSVVMAQAVDLRLAHGSPRGHPNYTHAEMLAEAIKKNSNGDVNITVYGDRQLGDDGDMIQLVTSGTVDMAYASSVNFPLILNKVAFDALQLPGLVPTYDDLGKMLVSPPAIKMLDSLEDAGIKGLCFSEGGQRHFLNRNGPIKSVDDFKGLKTRIVPIPLHKEIWTRLGANPIGVPYGEVYTAMQTKVIDGVEFNISSIVADKVYENANYVTLTGHYFWPGLFFMNKAKYDSLTPDEQKVIVDTCRGLTPAFVAQTKGEEAKQVQILKDAGVEISTFPDRANLLKATQPVFDAWSAKDPLIGEYIAEAKKLNP
jgi:tripartite ATP-independent transporter DctP family solute receptor